MRHLQQIQVIKIMTCCAAVHTLHYPVESISDATAPICYISHWDGNITVRSWTCFMSLSCLYSLDIFPQIWIVNTSCQSLRIGSQKRCPCNIASLPCKLNHGRSSYSVTYIYSHTSVIDQWIILKQKSTLPCANGWKIFPQLGIIMHHLSSVPWVLNMLLPFGR